MDTPVINPETRQAAIHTLAVVGFLALLGGGMWLAVYSARYVPDVIGRIGSAAVYLGSVFTPADEPTLSVVPTPVASTTIPFGNTSSNVPPVSTPVSPKPVQPTAGTPTTNTYPISGTSAPAALSGLPDLIVSIDATGYLATNSAESFVASSTVSSTLRPAVRFTIKNIGTNVTGSWRWSASLPTLSGYVYQSAPQQSLAPGDSIEYALGFDQPRVGVDQMISVTANSDHTVAESTSSNNSASAKMTILGS